MYQTGDWSAADLVKYLASIRKELTSEEIARLAQTKAFSAETEPPTYATTKPATSPSEKTQSPVPATRYIASELFEPSDANRALGLPVLTWSHQSRWRSNSAEGKTIYLNHIKLLIIV
jgi:hypothetical protein